MLEEHHGWILDTDRHSLGESYLFYGVCTGLWHRLSLRKLHAQSTMPRHLKPQDGEKFTRIAPLGHLFLAKPSISRIHDFSIGARLILAQTGPSAMHA